MKNLFIRNIIGLLLGIGVLVLIRFFSETEINISLIIPIIPVFAYFTFFDLKNINNDKRKLIAGIKLIKDSYTFSYDNMLISLKDENKDTLIVRNQLFWEKIDKQSTSEIEKNINYLIKDFAKFVEEKKEFKAFVSGKTIEFLLIDNISKEKDYLLGQKTINFSEINTY